MDRELGAGLLLVVLVATAGCAGILGSEEAEVEVGSEAGPQGQTFVYVESVDGQLAEGAEITVEHTLPGVENVSGTTERPASEGTKVYLGGPLGSDSVTAFRHGMPPSTSVVPDGVTVTVTVTVDTGSQTTTETLTFEA